MYTIGDKIPVWWSTFDKNEKGENMATIISIRDYKGPFDFCNLILKLTAPNTKRGWLEMTV
jgi:hypothetical protein